MLHQCPWWYAGRSNKFGTPCGRCKSTMSANPPAKYSRDAKCGSHSRPDTIRGHPVEIPAALQDQQARSQRLSNRVAWRCQERDAHEAGAYFSWPRHSTMQVRDGANGPACRAEATSQRGAWLQCCWYHALRSAAPGCRQDPATVSTQPIDIESSRP